MCEHDGMIRTQVQFTDEQVQALRKLSASTGRSIADLVRQGVDSYLNTKPAPRPAHQVERALRVAGRFSSGASDVSAHHDRYLAQASRR